MLQRRPCIEERYARLPVARCLYDLLRQFATLPAERSDVARRHASTLCVSGIERNVKHRKFGGRYSISNASAVNGLKLKLISWPGVGNGRNLA